MTNSSYSSLDRFLHSMALGSSMIKTISFDLERNLNNVQVQRIIHEPHVFIAGLARAGTSLLLRTLYTKGDFATLTYRDMPFVLAPQLWRKINTRHRRTVDTNERAHGDGLNVNMDTVEAFEEVFWLTFAGREFVDSDRLIPHIVNKELNERFRQYVAIVVAASDHGVTRYLSKNNNNILRIPGLLATLPESKIIVPFRNPYQQARSLLRQHKRFLKIHAKDRFGRRYMKWLGHFEFGPDYLPMIFDSEVIRIHAGEMESVNHWLENWEQVYRAVLKNESKRLIFWDYDAFCADPYMKLEELSKQIGLEGTLKDGTTTHIQPPTHYEKDDDPNPGLLETANKVHLKLKERAIRQL